MQMMTLISILGIIYIIRIPSWKENSVFGHAPNQDAVAVLR